MRGRLRGPYRRPRWICCGKGRLDASDAVRAADTCSSTAVATASDAGAAWLGAATGRRRRGTLRGCAPVALHAVLNGTCNVILSAMEQGAAYAAALAEAQSQGFAEADPTLDVGGFDAAHKLSILARLAFDPDLDYQALKSDTRGIAGVSAKQFAAQAARGRTIRLVGSIESEAGKWRAKVGPVSLPRDHPLVTSGPINTMLFTGDPLGSVMLRGPGAGGGATASAVMGDVLAAAAGVPGHVPVRQVVAPAAQAAAGDIEELAGS